ncbi:TIGR02117 family protein [Elizabethkingia anophelis]|uniref:TIGR02117 family protein n=1 Tax=Elizabethkingia TaxID=308865 RepID=UPI0007399D99|nr:MULTISPECIES: TIGR02117 family protein [Elizabethkingia]KUF41493.1 urease-associated protein [Elizabethkingia anophelis]MCT3643801.1 TIGR02117 family protein [Elizabethkingia anophelis]MCT3650900.1 TIGR02117 family protein [Elizabethkingia anophelis]MCT3654374.1 TIGR02117 family protein [Elizabethkingia anophelis]MCT3658614.1 TIGR02117 family protein [Elizabethkingia anophelis]
MRKILVWSLKLIGSIVGIVILYLLLGYFIPFIPVKAEKTDDPKLIEAYIMTNGVHTDLVVPVKHELMDWSQKVLFSQTKGKNTDFNYIAFGWGDKGFYLDTPTWADLKFSTAFKAAFWMGQSAMHATYYREVKEGEDCKKIMLTVAQYKRLVEYIDSKFDKDQQGNYMFIPTNAVYGNDDAFYDARGSYNFLYTCNTWANDGLKAAGQKAALWTPSDFGIFQHYK